MKPIAVILGLMWVMGCTTTPRNTLVLNYGDFGPQAAAYETIGMEWWQWDNHGDPDPRKSCDVKVVVYRDVSLDVVRAQYPVLKDKKQDYRYLAYTKALEYLEKTIQESKEVIPEMAQSLEETQTRIIKELGRPNTASHGTALPRRP